MSTTIKLTHSGEGNSRTTTASHESSKPFDFLVTMFNYDKAVTGVQKGLQQLTLVAAGASLHKFGVTGVLDPLAIVESVPRIR